MKLTLIRHGETPANTQRLFQRDSISLNQRGLVQAEVVSKKIQGAQALFSSPYPRAMQTAEVLSHNFGVDIQVTDTLKEVRFPESLQQTLYTWEILLQHLRISAHCVEPRPQEHVEYESFAEITQRAEKFLQAVIALNLEHIVAVSHGLFIKALVGLALTASSYSPELFMTFQKGLSVKNTAINHLLYENGEWWVERLNDTSHYLEVEEIEKQSRPDNTDEVRVKSTL